MAGGGFAEQPFERPGDGVGVPGLDEQARDISLYDTLVAVDVARDDWQPGRHGLEEDDPEGLLAGRGSAEDVRRLVEARLVDIRHPPGEEHVLRRFRRTNRRSFPSS